ncbi:unnamed protein product, partial [Mesorhabditis spiculigera]
MLRAALLNKTKPESLIGIQKVADNGVQAEYIRPVFPTHSWPNWLSLVTGLRKKLSFERGSGPNDTDDLWWQGLPAPLWYTAGKKRVDVHCYYFAHCHRVNGDLIVMVPPERVMDLSYQDQTADLAEHFAPIVRKISRHQHKRQQLVLMRYGNLANAIREFGEGSDEVEGELSRIDLHIHDLQKKLEEQKLDESTNLIIVSDHGLGKVLEEEQYFLEECLSDYSKVTKLVNSHGMVMVFTKPDDEFNIFYEFKVCEQWAPQGDYDEDEQQPVVVYRMADIPENLRWAGSRFMSGIVLITRPGVTVVSRELPSIPAEVSTTVKAVGGWEPDSPEMRGIFLAKGPAFKVNEKYGPIDMVDVYQVALNILGIEPPHPHNGTWSQIETMLAEGWDERPNSENAISSRFSVSGLISVVSILLLRLLL